MNYGALAGNSHINARIHEMLEDLHQDDSLKFVRKFRAERDEQRFHTFRELIVGSKIRKLMIDTRYEQELAGKTPDWLIKDEAGNVVELVDVFTLHQRRETESDMFETISTGAIWTGWVTIPPDHLYAKIEQKANAYAALVRSILRPYTLFIFGEFTAWVDPEEVEHVLYKHHGGVFLTQPTLASVVYFFEHEGRYLYSFFSNPEATYTSVLLPRLRGFGSIAA